MTRRLAIDASFDLAATLNGEQDFRWLPRPDCWHSGVLDGYLVHVRHVDGGLEYRARENLDSLLGSYFRVDDDLDAIWGALTAGDETLRKLHVQHGHVRLRRQPDRWECIVSYICSANRSVGGVRASVEKIAKSLGEPVEFDDDRRHTFPSVERVLEAGEEGLEGLRLGLDKHRKIVAAAREIADGRLDLEALAGPGVHYGEARLRLMGCEGIGPKIADCIALFSLDKLDAFPVDRWVRRAIRSRYFEGRAPSDEKLVAWALRTFGPYAGYANQLLFHAERGRAVRAKRPVGTRSPRVPARANAGRGGAMTDVDARESSTGSRRASSPAGGSSTARRASSTTEAWLPRGPSWPSTESRGWSRPGGGS